MIYAIVTVTELTIGNCMLLLPADTKGLFLSIPVFFFLFLPKFQSGLLINLFNLKVAQRNHTK